MIRAWSSRLLLLRPLFLVITVIALLSIWRTFPVISQPTQTFKPVLNKQVQSGEDGLIDVDLKYDEDLTRDKNWELNEANVDLQFLLASLHRPKYYSSKCAKFPDFFTVKFNNIHWQSQNTRNESYFLYNAYLDLRWGKSGLDNSTVRVLGMSNGRLLNSKNSTLKYCQFWFANKSQPAFVQIVEVKFLWGGKWGKGQYFPYLITCQLPRNSRHTPMSVSLVSSKCENATNNLNIMHKNRVFPPSSRSPPEGRIGVCVKALDFPDRSMLPRLVEWIEMLRLLGASKIFFYEYYVDPAIKKILDYYESEGFVVVTPTTLPGELPNQPQLRHQYIHMKKNNKRLTEVVPYNDCLYRNMYDFKYLAVVDTDEVILPKLDQQWSQLLTTINEEIATQNQPISTYCFRNFYYIHDMLTNHENEYDKDILGIPDSFHMLRHVYRTSNSTGNSFMKCFHSTQHTLGVHNHFAFYCTEGKCRRHYVDVRLAQMNHYRETCVKELKNCKEFLSNSVKDTTLLRYRDALISRVNKVLHKIP